MQKRIKRWWNGQRVPVYHDGETEGPGGMGKLPDEWVTVYSPSASATRKIVEWASSAFDVGWKYIVGLGILATVAQGYVSLKQAQLLPSFLDNVAQRPGKQAEAQDEAGQTKEKKLPNADAPTTEHSKPPVAPSEAQPEASRPGVSRAP